jgi:flagellar hook-length control protein FliK
VAPPPAAPLAPRSPRQTVLLTLDPPLGRVVVRLTAQAGNLSAVVITRGAQAYQALRSCQPEVLAALGRSGHAVASLRIAHISSPGDRSADRPPQRRKR